MPQASTIAATTDGELVKINIFKNGKGLQSINGMKNVVSETHFSVLRIK